MEGEYNQNGSYLALAGLLVTLFAKFGVFTSVDTIVLIFGAISSVIGIVVQFRAHKKLAITTGAYYRRR